jgi:DNA-binding transcriptional regulator YhcF (GntR family)
MKKESYSSETLSNYLKNKKIATIDELKDTLKTQSRMTVFRNLKKLGYISSCSHSGKYYSLKEIAEYNKYGIWLHGEILFSKYETLKKTLKHLIYDSPEGYAASELHNILSVKVDDALLELTKDNVVVRQKISGVYIYCSKLLKSSKRQELIGHKNIRYPGLEMDDEKASLIIFFSVLNEKQRRLYAGLESSRIGHGGDRQIAELLGINEKTVAKGRKELLNNQINIDSVRKKGGGRYSIKKKAQI